MKINIQTGSEGIEQIDWEELGNHHIPDFLRQLVSDDKFIRGKAHEIIIITIVEGDASFDDINLGANLCKILKSDLQLRLIPFLIEATSLEKIHDKFYEYDILIEFAEYVDFQGSEEIYKKRACQIRKAIWHGKTMYIKHLYHNNTNTRLYAFILLCHYNEFSDEIIPVLLERLKTEVDEKTKLQFIHYFYQTIVRLDLLLADDDKTWKDLIAYIPEEAYMFTLRQPYKKFDNPDC